MTIEYTWEFSQFDTKPHEDGMTNVVSCIHWRLTGQDADGYMASNYGTVNVGTPSPDNFTPYESITKEQTIAWMESATDVASIKANIAGQIERDRNPPVVPMVPPFDSPSE